MATLKEKIDQAAMAIGPRFSITPKVGIILGTGLGGLTKAAKDTVQIPYEEVPFFPASTVQSHAGQLVAGTLSNVPVVMMEGRFHFYEGYTLEQVTFPVRVMKALGVETLIVTNACGGLNHQYERGDIAIIEDHINLMGINPLIGPNDESLGPRFPDMYAPYDLEYVEQVLDIGYREGIRVQKSVYAAMTGPCLETRAEYRMLKTLGADLIGMSTVPEVIVAVHAGLRTLGLSVVTDMCLPDALQAVNIEEIIETANVTGPKIERLILRFLEGLSS